jgi:hypothetical protein
LFPAPSRITFVDTEPISVITAAAPSDAKRLAAAELLTIVLTVVVTVEIILLSLSCPHYKHKTGVLSILRKVVTLCRGEMGLDYFSG